ncbi:MAG: hypothetical protein ACJAVA_000274 [Flavobacteriaceae bacterium]|jgi:hypothetical protein
MFEPKKKDKEGIKETRKKEVEKKLIFSHRILPHRGHKIWKYNIKTQELSECEFTEDSREIKWEDATKKDYKQKNKKVLKEDSCIYFNALNRVNAIKVLKRDFNIKF